MLDVVSMTQKHIQKAKFTVAASDIQNHVAFNSLLKKKRVAIKSGNAIQWQVMTKHGGAAKVTGLFAQDDVNYVSVMQTANIPWRHVTTNYAIDEIMIAMNSKPAQIVDLVKVGRIQAFIGLAELMEELFWTDTAAADTDNPLGVPYYIVRNASAGFNGGNPTYDATNGAANLDSSTYTRWANWTDRYVSVTKTDLIRRLRKAAVFTKFVNPVAAPTYSTGDDRGLYTNYDVVGALEEKLEDQNDNLGNDIASKDGKTVFRGTPITHVPYLDSAAGQAAQDPIYGINWGDFKVAILHGRWLKELGPFRAAHNHTVAETHIDASYNLMCTDRRKQFILDVA